MLTVAILNYNGADTLRESIQSVLDQTLKPDRFVVIDNASTDGSDQIARDMGVEVVNANNKHKFITGLNVALSLNKDLLFFMQNDVSLNRGCLKQMILNKPASNFIAQPQIIELSKRIDNTGMDIIWPGYGQRRNTKWWKKSGSQNCGLVTTICFLTDNKNLLYDTDFSPAYYEDLDFAVRSKKLGMQHVLITAGLSMHKGNHTFSQTLTKTKISALCRTNRKKFISKNYHGLDKFTRLIAINILDTIQTCARTLAPFFFH